MPHEYEIDHTDSNGKSKTRKVEMPDHQHHEKWKDYALFLGAVASVVGITKEAITAVRYIRRTGRMI